MGNLWVLIVAALSIIPMFKILPHFGINKYWALVCIVPIGTIAMLWWVATKIQELERR
jgi:hypothetical protein